MQENQYLSGHYGMKFNFRRLALVVLIFGALLGGGLILGGVIRGATFEDEWAKTDAVASESIDQISEIVSLSSKISTLRAQMQAEFDANGATETYLTLQAELASTESTLQALQSAGTQSTLNNSYDNLEKGAAKRSATLPFFISGGIVLALTLLLSGLIYLRARQLKTTAPAPQQFAPLHPASEQPAQPSPESTPPSPSQGSATLSPDLTPPPTYEENSSPDQY